MNRAHDYYRKFGNTWSASGALGYFGEGYWFHAYLKALGIRFKDIVLAAKTFTLDPRPSIEMVARCKFDLAYREKFERLMGDWRRFSPNDCGNMPFKLDPPFQPEELFPKSIWTNPFSEFIGNSISLSSPGFKALSESGRWQELEQDFLYSYMCLKKDEEEILDDHHQVTEILFSMQKKLKARNVGGQTNISCPNVEVKPLELLDKLGRQLDIPSPWPWIIKANIFMQPKLVRDICQHPNCGGICVTNTFTLEQIKQLPELHKKFIHAIGHMEMPLKCFPSAGFSGPAITPYVIDWLRKFREDGNEYYVNAGGGLDTAEKVREMRKYADSIMLGCSFTKLGGILNTNSMIEAAKG